jgi:hypothetical protein
MRNMNWLFKLGLVVLCAALLLGPAERLCGADDFYVIGGGSPWKRNGSKIYYMDGYVGIGTDNPSYPFHISSNAAFPMVVTSTASGVTVISGFSNAPSGTGKGVMGITYSVDGGSFGVYGKAASGGNAVGVYGYTNVGSREIMILAAATVSMALIAVPTARGSSGLILPTQVAAWECMVSQVQVVPLGS